VHRSYWVARKAVAAVEREGHRTELVLTSGDRVPVSRTYLPMLRQAGWLAF
jgi:DNA-binding LytR/AlgR family response regulator